MGTKEEDGWREIVEDDDDTQFRRCSCTIPRFFDLQMKNQFCASIEYTGCILCGCRLQFALRRTPVSIYFQWNMKVETHSKTLPLSRWNHRKIAVCMPWRALHHIGTVLVIP